MTKQEEIIGLADTLIRRKGYNAFSFYEIAEEVGIKTASVHYHFRTKSDLGVAVVERHINHFHSLIERLTGKSPMEKLNGFFSIYTDIQQENNVCLVGSMATDYYTLDVNVQQKLKELSALMLDWVGGFLEEGRNEHIFHFEGLSRSKALMIISNMLAIVQLSRLTSASDFEIIKTSILNELTNEPS
ncbi:MAG: TetR/AcrR family transcriptional regulator [Bacteroidota bacterium]